MELKKTGLPIIRNYLGRGKKSPGFTQAIGQVLDIIAVKDEPDYDAIKPVIKGETFPGHVKISFTKKGLTSVNIYTRLKGTAQWLFLGRDTYSPYLDNRPLTNNQAETREYMAIGLHNDDEVGQQSDIITVTFGG